MQIEKAKHLEDLWRFEKTNNEYSRGLWRHYKRENFVLMTQDILYGRKRPKNTGDYTQKNALMRPLNMNHAPRAW